MPNASIWASALIMAAAGSLTYGSTSEASPALVGKWGPVIPADIVPIHVLLLPTGKVMYWDRHDQGTHDRIPRLWDPATGVITKAADPGYDVFCSGHSFLRNGHVFIAGGHIMDFVGEAFARIYDPFTGTWNTSLPIMNKGRWYPTNRTLPNGDVLVISGDVTDGNPNPIPQVFNSRTQTWRTLDSASQALPWYPMIYPFSNDKVFMAGPPASTQFLDVHGRGRWEVVGSTQSKVLRAFGSSVMYEPGKIMLCGGGDQPPVASAEIIDLNVQSPKWSFTESMKFARRHHTATLLPDGTVIVTGGTSGRGFNNSIGSVFATELWDPTTGVWTTLASYKTMRNYHAFSLLLPDGRLLTGGGGHPSDDANGEPAHPDFEIFEPPYLFKGPRPAITGAPDSIAFGGTFRIGVDRPGKVQVTLLRLAAVTHAYDENQNFNRLPYQRESATGLAVSGPADSVQTQPGPHLLFVVDSAGVPSLGKIVYVTSGKPSSILPPGSAASGFRLAAGHGSLVAEGLDLAEGSECSLFNLHGEKVASLKAGASKKSRCEFRLPDAVRPGAYFAEIRGKGVVRSGMVLIP